MAVWLITGAGRGLGRELARAAQAAGHDVAVGVRGPRAPGSTTTPGDVLEVDLDVTDLAQTQAAVSAVLERFGTIDVLVNNAGRGLLGAVEEVSAAETRSLFDVNLFGLIEMTRAVLPTMRAARSGRIINIGSSAGIAGAAGVGLYCASKFAVAGLSEALAAELAPFNIQVMVVEPGAFRTDFLDSSSLQLPASSLAAYDGTPAHATLAGVSAGNHAQPGDPVRAAALILRVASADRLPLHLPVGADALETRTMVSDRLAAELRPWETASRATAHGS